MTDIPATDDTPASAETVLARLRTQPERRQLFGGFGPLVLAAVLLLAMVLLAPSVAPERVVERPVGADDATEEDAP